MYLVKRLFPITTRIYRFKCKRIIAVYINNNMVWPHPERHAGWTSCCCVVTNEHDSWSDNFVLRCISIHDIADVDMKLITGVLPGVYFHWAATQSQHSGNISPPRFSAIKITQMINWLYPTLCPRMTPSTDTAPFCLEGPFNEPLSLHALSNHTW